ncbi:KDP operon transcriptional regulatory protein KdpE [Phycisphaerales bacterium]|nr:KDP operon transcriptional regulatory protein KdpE [Phycisphaerales bacterium]
MTATPLTPATVGPAPLVLVVDDEPPIRKFLRATLTSRGFRVVEAGTVRDALIAATSQPPDVIILDLGLPDGDGLQVTRAVRGWASVPIIVLSARGQEQDKVSALDAGADDYLTKPFGTGELIARVRVALRHAARPPDSAKIGPYRCALGQRTLTVDLDKRAARVVDGGEEQVLRLTPTEFKLLATLVRHAGKVLTHRQIMTEVWGPAHADDVQYLRVYAGQLRAKIEADAAMPRFLTTEPGVGYRLAEPGDAADPT